MTESELKELRGLKQALEEYQQAVFANYPMDWCYDGGDIQMSVANIKRGGFAEGFQDGRKTGIALAIKRLQERSNELLNLFKLHREFGASGKDILDEVYALLRAVESLKLLLREN